MVSGQEGHGWLGWQRSCSNCEPAIVKQSLAMTNFSQMIQKPGKSLAETRRLIVELERKAKNWADLRPAVFLKAVNPSPLTLDIGIVEPW